MKKIPARVREQAAMICAIHASAPPIGIAWSAPSVPKPVDDLAFKAMRAAHVNPPADWRDMWAEAEAMLRTGWVPE